MWEFEHEMYPSSEENPCPYPDAEKILEHPIFSKLVKAVIGHLTEVDGDFTIELVNGDKITYHYRYAPHRSLERIGDKKFYITRPDGIQVEMDFDLYLEDYGGGGMIMGALTMYVHKKLGIKS
jgi:hypothetical protein